MPRPNRVTPASRLVAVADRGLFMGNRGVLHDAQGRLTGRRWTTDAWVTCLLAFKGRRRSLMQPRRYTELFFLDEATALAAGHRPCGECRRSDYLRYKALWAEVEGLSADTPIRVIERNLHLQRAKREPTGVTHRAALAQLPDGTMVVFDSGPDAEPWLVHGNRLLRWATCGYMESRHRPRREAVGVLTPAVTVAVLRAGYRPKLHSTAEGL